MTRSTITAIAAAISLSFSAAAMADTLSKTEYKAAKNNIKMEYKASKVRCGALKANEKDICMTEAKAIHHVALAELDATNKPSRDTRYQARIAKADADYEVSVEKCDDKAGNAKDICVREAEAAHTAAKVDAKILVKTSDAKNTANKQSAEAQGQANKEISEARKDAASKNRNAEYAVALEKCNALAGKPKDDCVNNAKEYHGKS